jgi:hypothetical protein
MPEQTPKGFRHWHRSPDNHTNAPPVHVRFTAESGEVWTVWDTTFSKFKHHRRAHGDPDAKLRVFVNAAGVTRSYTFKKHESRVLGPQELERQLREAERVGPFPDLRDRSFR